MGYRDPPMSDCLIVDLKAQESSAILDATATKQKEWMFMCRHVYKSDSKDSLRSIILKMNLEVKDIKTAEQLVKEIIPLTKGRYKGIVSFDYNFYPHDEAHEESFYQQNLLEFVLNVKAETFGQVDMISDFIIYSSDILCLGYIPDNIDDSIVGSISIHSE